MQPVRWDTKGGKVRWQPKRCDGCVLVGIFAMGSGMHIWYDEQEALRWAKHPRAYWWRWVAVVRGVIGDRALMRRESKQLVRKATT